MGKKKPKANGRKPAEKPPGCYVLSLSVENVRCFGQKQTLDCSDGKGRPRQWTVILGDNGSGKTTLLQATVLHADGVSPKQHRESQDEEDDFPLLAVYESVAFSLLRHPEGVAEAHLGWTHLNWATPSHMSELVHRPLGWRLSSSRWLLDSKQARSPQFHFVGYGANRAHMGQSVPRRGAGDHVRTLMSQTSGLQDCQEWLVQLDYSSKTINSSSHAGQQRLVQQLETLLVNVLPDVQGMRFDGGSGVFPKPRVEFLTPYGWVPLRQLGHGYQTMIAWVVDFVSRMVERYPDSENPLAEPAVCLVDEIDLHLHPVWQRKVIGYLSERFPKTQFIVTAHSPLVVQAAASADANIAVLVRSEKPDADGHHYVEIKNNPEDVRNWRLDQILTSDLFGGIDLRSIETEKLFARKRELLAKPRRTKAEETEYAQIEAEIAALPVGDTEKFARELDLLRRASEELKASRKQ